MTLPKINPDTTYDLTVIGAGSAGFSAAITAAEQGAKVALVGYGTIGGTCVNVGCVPSKTLIRAAETIHQANTANRFDGVEAKGQLNNWRDIIAQKDALVSELRQAKYLDLLPQYSNVTYIEGPARFTEDGLTVNGTPLKTGKIIIATGSRPTMPDIPGMTDIPYLTSTTTFELEQLPRSVMVIGGGYIGCEIAQMLSRVGVDVSIITRSRLISEAEPEISEALTTYLRDEGIRIYDGLSYQKIAQSPSGITLDILVGGAPTAISADQVLLTTGRQPNTDGLDLAAAGIATSPRGGIVIDEHMRTSRDNIFAAGDVTDGDQFVYMAAYGAKIAAQNAFEGTNHCYDNKAMPAVVFTDPQVASVGLTEATAKAAGHTTVTSVLPLSYVPRALAARDLRGLIKLVADADSKKLLGAQILAPEGADCIQTAALAIHKDMTYTELGDMIFPYLTTVEGLKLAAQTFEKDVAKLSCCAG